VALELADGKALNEVTGVVPFSGGPKGVEMNAFFIAPVAVTKDNLNVVIDAGWVSKDVVCQGAAAGSVAACN
jgi:D-xylose transport system substrate-binding protein